MNVKSVEPGSRAEVTRPHPLAPLTAAEISTVVSIIQASPLFGDQTRFETIELLEPPKSAVRAFRLGERLPR